jgi:hypothetical protein
MVSRLVWVGFALMLTTGLSLPGTSAAEARQKADPDKPAGKAEPKEEDLTQLCLEVQALRMLATLQATSAQMKALAALAPETAAKRPEAKECKASPKVRRTLRVLRDALAESDAEGVTEGITYLGGKFDALREAEDCELNDNFDVTAAARERAPDAVRLFRTRQIAAYLNSYGEDLAEPVTRVMYALEQGQGLKDKEWLEMRDAAADDVGWQIGGLDTERVSQVRKQVKEFLDKAHPLKEDEFKEQRPELEKQVRDKIVGKVDAIAVMRHVLERDLAQLLSNPELSAALKIRLAKEEK